MAFVDGAIANAGWDNRELPLVQQFETVSSGTNWSVALAFSEATARDVDGDGLSNTNETARGTDPESWDTDRDAIPDGYEVAHHLNPLVDDAAADKDTDGVPNWNEYVANTGADDPDSFLQIIDASGTAAVNLVHPVATGKQLCQHHCPVALVAAEFPELCEAETRVFAQLLDSHVQRLATIAHGDGVCTTHVPRPVKPSDHPNRKAAS